MPRASASANKAVNLEQLDAELGGHGLCLNGDGSIILVASDSPVTRAELEAAIGAHVAEFPPDPDDEFRSAIESAATVDDLKAAILGNVGPGAEPRRGRPA